jgi:hypothetical protein
LYGKKISTPTLVINIKREFFAAILAAPRRKHVEYREISEYWSNRLERVGKPPFNLRMLNGMTPPVPEATILVTKMVKNKRTNEFEFHLGKVLNVKHWNRKKERPYKITSKSRQSLGKCC